VRPYNKSGRSERRTKTTNLGRDRSMSSPYTFDRRSWTFAGLSVVAVAVTSTGSFPAPFFFFDSFLRFWLFIAVLLPNCRLLGTRRRIAIPEQGKDPDHAERFPQICRYLSGIVKNYQ
jgi:hypothetical protein